MGRRPGAGPSPSPTPPTPLTLDRFGALDLRVETKPDLTPVSRRRPRRRARACGPSSSTASGPPTPCVGEEYGVTGESRPALGARPDRRHQELRPRRAGVGHPHRAHRRCSEPRSEDVVVGVVSAPALGRRWWAARGGGAWLRDAGRGARPIAVSGVTELGDASVSFSEWNDPTWEVGGRPRRAVAELLLDARLAVPRVRRLLVAHAGGRGRRSTSPSSPS